MKKTIFAVLFLFCLAATPSFAGQKPAVVAIVDVQRLLQDASAAKSVQGQLEQQRSTFQTEIALEESELRKAEQKLAKMRDAGQADAYAEEEQKLRQRFLTVEKKVQARRKALDQAFTESMNAVREGIIKIVSDVSKERGVNLAIVKQQVIWNDQAVDITEEVLERLNKALPKLEVKIAPEEGETIPPLTSAPRGKKK